MRTVFDIAAWFVSKEPMNHEKLQGLVYLSYAWFYTLNHSLLFETEGFEALPTMIAEMTLFQTYHDLGKQKIRSISGKQLSSEIQGFLESVYETYHLADGEGISSYLRQSMPYKNARLHQSKVSRKDMKAFYGPQQQH